MGRKEKIPPPPLLTKTTVRGMGGAVAEEGAADKACNAFKSCRQAISPTSNVTGFPSPAAYPMAVLRIPSIPEAPLFIATLAKGAAPPVSIAAEEEEEEEEGEEEEEEQVAKTSTSRTGMLLERKRPWPAGRRRATR
jgi:hypothetical protein